MKHHVEQNLSWTAGRITTSENTEYRVGNKKTQYYALCPSMTTVDRYECSVPYAYQKNADDHWVLRKSSLPISYLKTNGGRWSRFMTKVEDILTEEYTQCTNSQLALILLKRKYLQPIGSYKRTYLIALPINLEGSIVNISTKSISMHLYELNPIKYLFYTMNSYRCPEDSFNSQKTKLSKNVGFSNSVTSIKQVLLVDIIADPILRTKYYANTQYYVLSPYYATPDASAGLNIRAKTYMKARTLWNVHTNLKNETEKFKKMMCALQTQILNWQREPSKILSCGNYLIQFEKSATELLDSIQHTTNPEEIHLYIETIHGYLKILEDWEEKERKIRMSKYIIPPSPPSRKRKSTEPVENSHKQKKVCVIVL